MTRLPNKHRFVEGQIACRSLRPWSAGEPTILAIPGGPGLGGQYLEPFLLALAEATAMNVALLDLPNHGESMLRENGRPLNYRRSVDLLHAAVGEIADVAGDLVLFGQSLGARIAFELLPASDAKLTAAILTGFPCQFENSSALAKSLSDVSFEDLTGGPDDEAIFARNWRKVLPFYTPAPLPPEAAEQLSAGTRWRGNERMLEGVPSLEASAARLKGRTPAVPILMIQGGKDLVVPDGNLQRLQLALPEAEFREVADAGHFVMVEKPSVTVSLVTEFLKKHGGRP